MKEYGERVQTIIANATNKYGLNQDQLHVGHLVLEGLRSDPEYVHQIDAVKDEKQTNLEVAALSARLADAMQKSGLKSGDHVVIVGPNYLWASLAFYACHYNGYGACNIDPYLPQREIEHLFSNVRPKLVICSKQHRDALHKALTVNDLNSRLITYQGAYNIDAFIEEFNGSEEGFKPLVFDQKETTAWLILTSGTTGMPKVAVVTFDTLFKNVLVWWKSLTIPLKTVFSVSSIQWLSSLIYHIMTPGLGLTRVQSSAEVMNPAHVREIINKYRPQTTTFAPYLFRQFVKQELDACDVSCLMMVGIAGGAVDDDDLNAFKSKFKGFVAMMYGMTETLIFPFINVPNAPHGSIGLAIPHYSYKLIDDDGNEINEPNKIGELWWKGGNFFKGYLNNPEETANTLTPDGWIKTGDLMSRDENNFYYFHERKKLLIKYKGLQVAPIEIENVIKKHPSVSEAVVVGIPDFDLTQLSTAALMPIAGTVVDPSEIFALVDADLPIHKRLHGGLFFVTEYPLTPSGKINRPAVLQEALKAQRILDPNVNSKETITAPVFTTAVTSVPVTTAAVTSAAVTLAAETLAAETSAAVTTAAVTAAVVTSAVVAPPIVVSNVDAPAGVTSPVVANTNGVAISTPTAVIENGTKSTQTPEQPTPAPRPQSRPCCIIL